MSSSENSDLISISEQSKTGRKVKKSFITAINGMRIIERVILSIVIMAVFAWTIFVAYSSYDAYKSSHGYTVTSEVEVIEENVMPEN